MAKNTSVHISLSPNTEKITSFSIKCTRDNLEYQPACMRKGRNLSAIICLTGKKDTGKTSSLLKLASMLDTQIDSQLAHDKWLIIKYKGKIVLLTTAGDTKDIVENSCALCSFIRPDIFVTAIRTPGGRMATMNYFLSKAKEPFQYFKVAKKDIGNNKKKEEYEKESLRTAEGLKQLIDDFC